jgi:tetratricopeptide (TPR) repeat protein
MGKIDLAMERARLSLRLSPFDIYNFRSSYALAIAHFHKQRYAEALDAAASTVHANPSFSIGHATLAAALLRAGRTVEAKTAAQHVLEHEPTFTIHGFSQIVAFEPAVFEPLAAAWREIGLPE